MNFRTKTILGVALIEMVLLVILVSSALSILRDSNEAELTRRVQLGGQLLAVAAKDAVISEDLATLDSLVAEAMASGQIAFVRIVDAAGVVLAERGDASLLARTFHPQAHIDQVSDGIFDWVAPIMAGRIQQGEVRLGVSTAPMKGLLASAQRWAAGIAAMEMVLVALFSWLLGSYLARQLVALRSASYRFAAGDFDYRVPIKGNDDLAQTAQAFNSMAQQLGDSNELLRTENMMRQDAQLVAERAQAWAEDKSEQLTAIFALSPDGFVSFDMQRRVKYASPAFMRLTGLTESEIVGLDEGTFSERLARECTSPASFPGISALRSAQRISTSSAQRQTIEIAGAGKRILEIGLRVSQAGTVTQILYLRDITHESEVDRLKSEFLSMAAHELRTPMASIYGFTELMLTQAFTPEECNEFLETIFRQSELMISIINELLDLARIEARRGTDFSIESIDLCELLPKIITGFRAPNGRDSPELRVAVGSQCIRADRNKLTQAVLNVLSNAYKYSPERSAVSVELTPIAPGSSLSGIRITDHGIGMTPAQCARIFERFYRVDTSGKIPGTGLGMSIVHEIVQLHGGQVEITSQIGVGSTVTLWFPTPVVPS
jgi:PAS domain S-box-containing protein